MDPGKRIMVLFIQEEVDFLVTVLEEAADMAADNYEDENSLHWEHMAERLIGRFHRFTSTPEELGLDEPKDS